MSKHIPDIRVILHVDRDQKSDSDNDLVKLRKDCENNGIAFFVTKYQEIESYFCQPKHLNLVYEILIDEVKEKYKEWIDQLEDKTRKKLTNFILRDRPSLGRNSDGNIDIKIIEAQVDEWIVRDKEIFTPGKELLGKAKNYLQENGKDPNIILSISEGLICPEFQRMIGSLISIKDFLGD